MLTHKTGCVFVVMCHSVMSQPVGCAHISDLAEKNYVLGISKAQRRKFSYFHPDTSVRRIQPFLIGQRSKISNIINRAHYRDMTDKPKQDTPL